MPLQTIRLNPGIDVEKTPTLNSAGWSFSNLIRFFEGLPQKIGGWIRLSNTVLVGLGRGMHAWADLSGTPHLAVGTNQRLELFTQGVVTDITPLRATHNVAVSVSTVMNSTVVKITDSIDGVAVGDWVNVNVPISVGGIIIQGFYQVQSIIDANNYTIVSTVPAVSTVNNGGAVPLFNTTMSSPNVSVTLDNHGYTSGALFTVQVATTVGGITMGAYTVYSVVSITNANVFVIAPGASAGSTASASENGGDAQYLYLIPTGLASATALTGYGTGIYGAGIYGASTGSTLVAPLRQWFLDNWGQDLIGNYTNGPLYVWIPPSAPGNVAIQIGSGSIPATDAPVTVNSSFVAMPQQIMVVLGSDPAGGGNQDPNLIRWSDVADYTDWLATTANQAGSFRIPSGSRIVGGIQAPQFGIIWTDVDMWLMNYVQPPFVFGFQKVGVGVDLLSARAAGLWESLVFWASSNGFFVYDGSGVTNIPCPVWDKFWFNLDRTQKDKVFAAVNSWFQEISWYYPSATGNGEVDSRITFNMREQSWTYDAPGSIARTCWVDDNVFGAPIGTDLNMLIQQHENGNDADGTPILASVRSGWFSISDGSVFTFIERVLTDLIVTGGTQRAYITFYVQDYPTDPVVTYGPYAWVAGVGPPYSIVRARGRMASIQISSNDFGVFWRLGAVRYIGQPAGRR